MSKKLVITEKQLELIVNVINEGSDPGFLKWKRKNVTIRGMKETGKENGAGAAFGDGLYTAFLSNKALAKQYGEVSYVLNAIPKKPKVVDNWNSAEIFIQNLVNDYCKENGKKYDTTYFYKNTTIAKEMLKRGLDGLVIKGREMVNYKPEDVKYFNNDWSLENYYV